MAQEAVEFGAAGRARPFRRDWAWLALVVAVLMSLSQGPTVTDRLRWIDSSPPLWLVPFVLAAGLIAGAVLAVVARWPRDRADGAGRAFSRRWLRAFALAASVASVTWLAAFAFVVAGRARVQAEFRALTTAIAQDAERQIAQGVEPRKVDLTRFVSAAKPFFRHSQSVELAVDDQQQAWRFPWCVSLGASIRPYGVFDQGLGRSFRFVYLPVAQRTEPFPRSGYLGSGWQSTASPRERPAESGPAVRHTGFGKAPRPAAE